MRVGLARLGACGRAGSEWLSGEIVSHNPVADTGKAAHRCGCAGAG